MRVQRQSDKASDDWRGVARPCVAGECRERRGEPRTGTGPATTDAYARTAEGPPLPPAGDGESVTGKKGGGDARHQPASQPRTSQAPATVSPTVAVPTVTVGSSALPHPNRPTRCRAALRRAARLLHRPVSQLRVSSRSRARPSASGRVQHRACARRPRQVPSPLCPAHARLTPAHHTPRTPPPSARAHRSLARPLPTAFTHSLLPRLDHNHSAQRTRRTHRAPHTVQRRTLHPRIPTILPSPIPHPPLPSAPHRTTHAGSPYPRQSLFPRSTRPAHSQRLHHVPGSVSGQLSAAAVVVAAVAEE